MSAQPSENRRNTEPPAMIVHRDEDRRHPEPPAMIVHREDWDLFVNIGKLERPQMPSARELRAMTQLERKRFDRVRMNYHLGFGALETPHVLDIRNLGLELIELNSQAVASARYGLIVDGDAMLGKTTALLDFGKTYERAIRHRYPSGLTVTGDDLIPVVYVSVAADTTIKGLNKAILEFCGMPWSGKSKDDLTFVLQKLARRCATTLFLIDDVHHIDTRYREHRRLSEHLKHLASTIAATFVYSGIDCEESSILQTQTSGSNRSTARRMVLHPVRPYERSSKEGQERWLELLAGFESELLLLKAKPGMLRKLDAYIYTRTGGVIGAVSQLIRLAANRAIKNGDEQITKKLLEGVKINHGAESRQ